MRKHGDVTLLIFLVAAAVAACGPGPSASAESGDPAEAGDVARSGGLQVSNAAEPQSTYDRLLRQHGLLSDRPEALKAWEALAEEGFAPAQLAVGIAYALGKGAARDIDRAMVWLTEAAEAGNATAQYNLSLVHISRGDFADAYEWTSVVAQRGSGQIQYEAQRHGKLLALVVPRVDFEKAKRSATDWLEELPADYSVGNLGSDRELAVASLPEPPDGSSWSRLGWRDIAKLIQSSAEANFREGHMLQQRATGN